MSPCYFVTFKWNDRVFLNTPMYTAILNGR